MSKTRKKLYMGFALYYAALLMMTVFPPIVELWNTINPHVLGFPFAQFMVILISLLLAAGLVLWFYLEGNLNNKERAIREKGGRLDY